MEAFVYPIEADNKIYSKTVRALANRPISIRPDDEIAHPFRPIQFTVTGLGTSLDVFLQKLQAFPNAGITVEQNDELIRAFEDVTFRAAEYFEAYKKIASKYLDGHKKKAHKPAFGIYETRHKARRDLFALICNKLKHNANVVQIARHTEMYYGASVIAFQVCKPAGLDRLVTNTDVHKGRGRAWSFNSSLRQLIYDVLAVDHAGETLVNAITPDLDAPVACPDLELPLMSAIGKIDKLPARYLSGEPLPKPGFVLSAAAVACDKIALTPFSGEIRVEGFLHRDGMTKSFEVMDR